MHSVFDVLPRSLHQTDRDPINARGCRANTDCAFLYLLKCWVQVPDQIWSGFSLRPTYQWIVEKVAVRGEALEYSLLKHSDFVFGIIVNNTVVDERFLSSGAVLVVPAHNLVNVRGLFSAVKHVLPVRPLRLPNRGEECSLLT